MKITATLSKQADGYMARCEEVGVTTRGKTPEKAVDNMKRALEIYFEEEILPGGVQLEIIDSEQSS